MKLKAIFILLVLSIIRVYSLIDYEDYILIKENYFPNKEGSPDEVKLMNYIEEFCRDRGIVYKKTRVEGDDYYTNSFNIEATVRGFARDRERIGIIIPVNSKIIAGRYYDRSVPVFIGLKLLDFMKRYYPSNDFVFVFIGAAGRPDGVPLGLKSYLYGSSSAFDGGIVTVLDLIDNDEQIIFTGSKNDRSLTLDMFEFFERSGADRYGITFNKDEILKSKFGIFNSSEFVEILSEYGNESAVFTNAMSITGRESLFTTARADELFMYFKRWIIRSDRQKYPMGSDCNFQIIGSNKHYIVVSEFVLVLSYLVLIMIVIFLRRAVFHFRMSNSILKIRVIPYFILIFIIYFGSSFITDLLAYAAGKILFLNIDFASFPFLYFLNVFIVSFFILIILIDFIKWFPAPKHNVVYIYGATLFSYFALLIVTLVDISLTYIYLTSIFFIMLSHVTGRIHVLKFLCYILAMVPFVFLIYEITGYADTMLVKNSFRYPVFQHAVFCLSSFPFLLLFVRMNIISTTKLKLLPSKISALITVSLIMVIAFIFFGTVYYSVERERVRYDSLVVSDYTSNKSVLKLRSDLILGKVSVYQGDFKTEYFAEKRIEIPLLLGRKLFDYKITRNGTSYVLKVSAASEMERVDVKLITESNIVPLNSNYRYMIDTVKVDSGGNSYRFITPEYPGKEFVVQLDLAGGYDYKIELSVRFSGVVGDLRIEAGGRNVNAATEMRETILFNSGANL